jgi:hypothetical protein
MKHSPAIETVVGVQEIASCLAMTSKKQYVEKSDTTMFNR